MCICTAYRKMFHVKRLQDKSPYFYTFAHEILLLKRYNI